jgi:hypothetical protein
MTNMIDKTKLYNMTNMIDKTKLWTQAAYAKYVGLTRGRINQMIKAKELKSVKINGTTLVYKED